MPKIRRIAVVSNSLALFEDFQYNIVREPVSKVVFVDSIEKVRGIEFCAIIKLADYKSIPNYKELICETHTRIR